MKNTHHTSAKAMTALVLLLTSAIAAAHTGADAGTHHHGFMAALLHPFTGLDHLLAMLAVGAWSALALRRVWLAPAAFASVLAVGAVLGMAGVALPFALQFVEPMVAASLLVIGLLVMRRQVLSNWAVVALVGAFALFHGLAHGTELGGADFAASLLGMLLGTLVLHGVGILLGHGLLQRHRWLPRVAGAAVALVGTGLLVQGWAA